MPKIENDREIRRPLTRTKAVHPESLTSAQEAELYLQAHECLQKIAVSRSPKEEVTKEILVDHSITLYVIGDLHFGHVSTATKEIEALRDRILSDPYACVVFVGDEIEGFTTKYPTSSTSKTHANAQEQIDFLKEILLRPLAEQGRVLGMVGEYFGHPGWLNDGSTLDPWKMMSEVTNIEDALRILKLYEDYKILIDNDIKIIANDGILNIVFPNGHTQSICIRHNPDGTSQNDPVYGLRKEATKVSVSLRPEGYTSGHIHRSGIAKEHYAGSDVPVYFISCGTAKGSDPETTPQDTFGTRLGKPRPDPIGQGVILTPRRRGQKFDRNYPFISFKQGDTARRGIDLLNATESQKITAELLEQINAADKPELQLMDRESRVIRSNSPYKEPAIKDPKEDPKDKKGLKADDITSENYPTKLSPVYDSLTYDVKTRLPIALHLIKDARIGSTVEGKLRDYHNDYIRNNPHAFVVYLRNMIDKEVATSENRGAVLSRLAKLINPVENQVIALLLDSNLRADGWDGMFVPPGTYLSHATNTPLIHHLSLVKLAIGPDTTSLAAKPLYIGAFADGLGKSGGSQDRPTFGLLQLYFGTSMPEKPGYMAGGNMPNAGTAMIHHLGNAETHNPAFIASGSLSPYFDSLGSKNVRETAIPGQAIIFMPGTTKKDYLVFPTANADETKYMHEALLLLEGLKLLGLKIEDVLPR